MTGFDGDSRAGMIGHNSVVDHSRDKVLLGYLSELDDLQEREDEIKKERKDIRKRMVAEGYDPMIVREVQKWRNDQKTEGLKMETKMRYLRAIGLLPSQ